MRYDDEDQDDYGYDDIDSGEPLTVSVANLLDELFDLGIPEDIPTDPAEFLVALHDHLETLASQSDDEDLDNDEELDEDELPDDAEELDDDEDLDEQPAPRRTQPQAMSSGPRLHGRLSHATKKSKPIVRRMTAERGKAIARQLLQQAGELPRPRPPETARLSHGRSSKGGPVSAQRGQAAAREIVGNCAWMRS